MEHRIRQARAAGDSMNLRYLPVPLDSISPHLQRVVVGAEDDRFPTHGGFDWEAVAQELNYTGNLPPRLRDPEDRAALLAALRYARENAEEIRGRSTLTQQLAKNLYLTPERSLIRKAREVIITFRLERILGKERILELYLNVAEWGPGIFGAEAASQAYFGKSARDLTRFEAVTLAATLPHPLTSNPLRNPARMQWRRNHLLNRFNPPTPPTPPHYPDTLLADSLQQDTLKEPPQSHPLPLENPERQPLQEGVQAAVQMGSQKPGREVQQPPTE
ncbi:MAG: biosynthetic peptidoglycan transglycosylase [Gemmatimonadota bacterium]